MLVILAVGACLRGAILVEHMMGNPFARAPVTDGAVYWAWADRLAEGVWLGSQPFTSAPLYPYLLGVLRWAGGGLLAVYVMQLLLDLATSAMLAWIGRARFGEVAGLLAAGVWLVLDEPAFYMTRVLNSNLQVFLVVGLWALIVLWQDRGGWGLVLGIGAVLGLNCLANPPMLLLGVALPVWMVVAARRGARGSEGATASPPAAGRVAPSPRLVASQGAVVALVAAVTIAPATWHNWQACGEVIPITAAPGITLRQGHGPGAVGTYVPIPGVSRGRDRLFTDAKRVYEQRVGRPGRWREVDAHFRDQALSWLAEDPIRAAGLVLRRVYWFVSGRHYSDVHQPSWERDTGLARLLWLAPLPTAWWMGPGLVGLVVLVRRPIRFGPEWLLLLVPFIVVALIQYSPRYRLPAVPVLAMTGAWAVAWCLRGRRPFWLAMVGGSLAVAALLGPINVATGFEDPSRLVYNNEYNLSVALGRLGKTEASIEHLERALRHWPASPEARNDLGVRLQEKGRLDAATEQYLLALRSRPGWSIAEANLWRVCRKRQRFRALVAYFQSRAREVPSSAGVQSQLAQAYDAAGRTDEAVASHRRAVELAPKDPLLQARFGSFLLDHGRAAEAVERFERARALAPRDRAVASALVSALRAADRHGRAIDVQRAVVASHPDDAEAINDLAWLLATCPEQAHRDAAEALTLAKRACRMSGDSDAGHLDTLAAAHAAAGDYERAVIVAQRALRRAKELHLDELVEAIEGRMKRYHSDAPYLDSP